MGDNCIHFLKSDLGQKNPFSITPFENAQRWMGKNTFHFLLLNDDNMIGEHQETRIEMPDMCPFEKKEKEFFFRLPIFFFRNKKIFSKEQLLFSFLCIVKQKKNFGSGISILVSQCSPIMLSSFKSKKWNVFLPIHL